MDKIIVLSKIAKENYNKNGLNNKLLIINNGRSVPKTFESIPDVDLNQINALKQSYTVLGTVASFDKRKGLEQILKLLKDEKELAFIIVGDGLERTKLNELAVTYNIAERFFILGRRPQGFRYITEFDYYVIPSRSEGMPLAMLEAAALKTPIICSDIPVFKEIFNSSEVSFLDLMILSL
ncbi:glycosyltransferase [Pedobacter steynii]